MAFCFKSNESVAKGIRRLGRKRAGKAVEFLQHSGSAEAIHGARREIKKMRAVLRVARKAIPAKEFRELSKLLGEAASGLAGARDAWTTAKTLREFNRQPARGDWRHLANALRNACREEMNRFDKENAAGEIKRTLTRIGKAFEHLNLRGKGWKILEPGLKAAFKQNHSAYQAALQDVSTKNFHKWRKRAKDLRYALALLRRVWPEPMDALTGQLEKLTEHLGKDHDVAVLRQAVKEQCPRPADGEEWETLDRVIDQRQRELRELAQVIGARIDAEKPSASCARLAGYWRIWRGERGGRGLKSAN